MDEEVNNLLSSGICFTVVFEGLKYNSYPKIIDMKAISEDHCIQLALNQDQFYLCHSHGVLPGLQSERSQCSMLSNDFVTMWWHWVSGTYALLCVTWTSKYLWTPAFGAYFCSKVLDDQPSQASLCCVSQASMNYKGDDTPFYCGGKQ